MLFPLAFLAGTAVGLVMAAVLLSPVMLVLWWRGRALRRDAQGA